MRLIKMEIVVFWDPKIKKKTGAFIKSKPKVIAYDTTASNTIKNEKLKSLLVELDENDLDYTKKVVSLLESAGMRLEEKRHSSMCENTEWASIYNYIFMKA